MKVKHHVSMEASRRIFQHTSFTLICERIHYKRQEEDEISQELFHLHMLLAGLLTHHDWDMVNNFTAVQAYLTVLSTTATQKRKFGRLLDIQQSEEGIDTEKVVVTITNRALDPAPMMILSKGLNCAQTMSLKSILKDVISGVERAI